MDASLDDEDVSIKMAPVDGDGDGETDPPVYHTSSGRVVYGGGGITPDLVFEPQTYNELERHLERDGLFFTFSIEYSTTHKIDEDFTVTDDLVEVFKEFLTEREFEYDDDDFTEESLAYVKKAITREIIAKNFGRKAMYRVLLNRDTEFQEVLEIYREAPTLSELFDYAERQDDVKKASIE